ncbi:MAG: RNA methyltransferase [Bacteroidales bacterium]|nr:RNA methyltransferase [Bacteroidales bacterium]
MTVTKAILKQIASYKQKKYRQQDNVFVVEGEKMMKEALHSSFRLVCICALEQWIKENGKLFADIPVYQVSPAELERISNLKTPDKVLAVLEEKTAKTDFASRIAEDELILCLDDIKNPGNLGTVIRLASWFGIKNIVCSEETVDCYNPKVVQATMGALFHTDIMYTDLYAFLKPLSAERNVYGAVVHGGKNIYKEKLSRGGIIIIGNESSGISAKVLKAVNNPISIPSFSKEKETESLNASMAAAVILSEFKRRTI